MLTPDDLPKYHPDFVKECKKCCWKGKPIIEYISEAIKQHGGDRTAIKSADSEILFKYSDLLESSKILAANLLEIGLEPRHIILMQLNNTPMFYLIWFALNRINAIPVHCLVPHRLRELSVWAEKTSAEGYVVPGIFKNFDYYFLAEELKDKSPNLQFLFTTESKERNGFISIPKLLKQSPSEKFLRKLEGIKVSGEDIALFLLSGGTTGVPKLIPRTHNDYAYNIELIARKSMLIPNTKTLICIPIAHNFAFQCGLGTLFNGGTVVTTDSTNPGSLMKIIQEERITFLPAVPAIFIRILNSPEKKNFDLSSLQIALLGGQKCPEDIAKRIEIEIGARFQNVYGMAEGHWIMTSLEDPENIRFRSSGKPVSPYDKYKVIDTTTGKECPPGVIGEIWVAGPYTIPGYYKEPEKNIKDFMEEGIYKYYNPGDLVYLDENGYIYYVRNGYIYYVSRSKDIINRGGEKIGAEEVENYLLQYPKIKEVAVIGMPDPELGERVCAYIVLAEGHKQFELKELQDFLDKLGVAKFKWPERIEFVDKLPTTAVGKIDKKALRKDIDRKLKEE